MAVLTDRRSQLLKGVLDMCLLSVIAEEPSYGYEMARKLDERGLALASEGSMNSSCTTPATKTPTASTMPGCGKLSRSHLKK